MLIFNQGFDQSAAQQGLISASVGADYAGTAPALFLNYPLGEALANTSNPVMRVEAPIFRGTHHESYLRFCMGNRDQCSLSVKHLNSGWQRAINGDRLQVTASVYKILMLIAYAEAVVKGDLDPATVIPRDNWARFSVRRDRAAGSSRAQCASWVADVAPSLTKASLIQVESPTIGLDKMAVRRHALVATRPLRRFAAAAGLLRRRRRSRTLR